MPASELHALNAALGDWQFCPIKAMFKCGLKLACVDCSISRLAILPYQGDVPLPDLSLSWCETLKTKREIYGPNMRIAVGGATTGEPLNHSDSDYEPVFFHCSPDVIVKELLRSESHATVMLDWTPTDVAARAAMELEVAYVGVVYTLAHQIAQSKLHS